jgi:hypothetical protein
VTFAIASAAEKPKAQGRLSKLLFLRSDCLYQISRRARNRGLTSVARKAGASSSAHHLASGPNAIIDKAPGKHAERQNKPKAKAPPINHATGSAPSMKAFTRTKTIQKVIPALKWIKIPVNFDRKEAEARFGIREFMMRFACIMEPPIAKVHLMELEDISGKCLEDEDEMVGWVGEACVRAIILGVLGLLAKQNDAKVCVVSLVAQSVNLSVVEACCNSRKGYPCNRNQSEQNLGYSLQASSCCQLRLRTRGTIFYT